jgi:signal transduction histidine kinase
VNDPATRPQIAAARAITPESTYRRRRLAGLLIVLGLLLVVVNVSQWYQHARLRERLDRELADRLLGVVEVAALGVDGEMLRRWSAWGVDADEEDRLRDRLEQVTLAGAVSSVFLIDPDGGSILDLSEVLERGEPNPLLALDRPAFTLAAAGIAAASKLRALDGQYLKAAYAPIETDDGEVVAVLGVEGAASLFEVLDSIRRTMVLVAAGSVLGIVVLGWILVRVSDSLARAERELLRAETLTSMGRMTAGIAHEVRNPLGIIRATAERLRRRLGDDQRARASADSIIEEVDRLSEVVTGYLNFATEKPGELGRVDLVQIVRRTLRLIEDELDGVGLSTELEVAEAPIRGDAARLHQVLLNLMLNARQAMPDGGELRIVLSAPDGDPPRFRLGIVDDGVGIARTQLAEIWRPFYTSKPEGSGLGLPIVRRIIEEHGGTVQIDSEVGQGTTVTLELPADAAGKPAAGKPAAAQEGAGQ